ncbi:Frataxin [Phlyctochytrium arcticum]|nr:Frataxin [Phlyctochytrium arcticum]
MATSTRISRNALRLCASVGGRASPANLTLKISASYNPIPSTTLPAQSPLRSYRPFSTSLPSLSSTKLTTQEYHRLSSTTLDTMVEALELLLDTSANQPANSDITFANGVMTLSLGDKGTYVVNKQPPNLQIWLSSPTSGPKRFDWDGSHWKCGKTGVVLEDLLESELSKVFGEKVDLSGDQ